MKKNSLFIACIFASFFAFAQQGTLSFLHNPSNPNGSEGDIATKIVANYKLYMVETTVYLDITWTISPTDYLFWQGKKYTIQQLGSQVFAELSISKNIVCVADAYFQGEKICEVDFDASGCASPNTYSKNPLISCTKQPIDSRNGDRSDLLRKSWNEAVAIWNSGKMSFRNLRLQSGTLSIYNPYPMVPNAIKASQGNPSSGQQANQQAANNTNSGIGSNTNTKTTSTSASGRSSGTTTSTSTTQKTKSTGQEMYNEIVNRSNNIVQISNDASSQVTQMVNSYYGTPEEQRAKREQQLKREEEQYKREQDAKDRLSNEGNRIAAELFAKNAAEYDNSEFNRLANINNDLLSDKVRFQDWVDACKSGTKESLAKYIAKYRSDYFAKEVAPAMINGWKYGKTNPNEYIKTAIFQNNWVLAKFLLENGANPDFQMQNAYGDCYNPILQLLRPKYSPALELAYLSEDKWDLLKKMILQGANASAVSKQITDHQTDFDQSTNKTVVCKSYVINEILCRDYKGIILKWLLENNKLNEEAKSAAMSYLIVQYGELASGWKSSYAQNLLKQCSSHFKLAPAKDQIIPAYYNGITVADNMLIQMQYLVQYKAKLSGSIPIGNEEITCLNTPFSVEKYPFFLTRDIPESSLANIDIWVGLQKAILSRYTDIDREYIRKLVVSIITKYPPYFSVTKLIDMIIDKGIIEPGSKELWYKTKYYNMVGLARADGVPEWVSYLKTKK